MENIKTVPLDDEYEIYARNMEIAKNTIINRSILSLKELDSIDELCREILSVVYLESPTIIDHRKWFSSYVLQTTDVLDKIRQLSADDTNKTVANITMFTDKMFKKILEIYNVCTFKKMEMRLPHLQLTECSPTCVYNMLANISQSTIEKYHRIQPTLSCAEEFGGVIRGDMHDILETYKMILSDQSIWADTVEKINKCLSLLKFITDSTNRWHALLYVNKAEGAIEKSIDKLKHDTSIICFRLSKYFDDSASIFDIEDGVKADIGALLDVTYKTYLKIESMTRFQLYTLTHLSLLQQAH